MVLGVLFGIIGGIIAGMGMGGGTLLIPLLVIFLDFSQLQAQTINLLAFLPMAIVTLFIHCKNKLIDFKSTYMLTIYGAIGAVGGAYLTTIIKVTVLRKLFGVFLLSLGVYELLKATRTQTKRYIYFKDEIKNNGNIW